MKVNWYYRMLLSYAPILFVIVSSLIFIFFMILNTSARQQFIDTHKAITNQVMQAVDANLQLTDRMVTDEFMQNKTLQDFFADKPLTIYDYYVIRRKLDDFSSALPFMNSIYLYNESNRKVLYDYGLAPLDQFSDKQFLISAYRNLAQKGWNDPRNYNEIVNGHNAQKVVTLVKLNPSETTNQGAIVVNVYVNSLIGFIDTLNQNNSDAIQLFDSGNHPFLSTFNKNNSYISARSPYTGWGYYSDSAHEYGFSILTLISNIWIILVLIIIVLALAGFTYITHINYKPIQAIMAKIHDYTLRKSEGLGRRSSHNELKFIETAIDHLMEKSVNYEKLHKEDMVLRKNYLFQQVLEGYQVFSEAQWCSRVKTFDLPCDYRYLNVVALEIDHYAGFVEKYNSSDQYLLKFVIENVFQEIAREYDFAIWQVWMQPHQLAAVFHLYSCDLPTDQRIAAMCRSIQAWIGGHLELTVSMGLGGEVDAIRNIALSYVKAKENLAYKPVFGTNVIIGGKEIETKTKAETFLYLQTIRETAHLYRLGEEQWQDKLHRFFRDLKQVLFSQADIRNLMSNLIYQLEKEIMTLPPEIQWLWRNEYNQRLEAATNQSDTIDELHNRIFDSLYSLAELIRQERLRGKNHSIVMQVKAFIDQHYADPDLSLNQIGDCFQIDPRYLSRLFKEELGEKFIDYVLRVRFDHARRLLLETRDPIQVVAEKVGYMQVISFHRAFKKMFGLPPGDFRKKAEL